ALLPLVDRYRRAKQDARAIDFGDQMEIAARVADRFAEVGRAERARYAAVLLDEYQDTGHAQLTMLRGLFGASAGGHPVTAVGDPAQAIYGWRGAGGDPGERPGAGARTARRAGSGPGRPAGDSRRRGRLAGRPGRGGVAGGRGRPAAAGR